jgi:hypothetical protein
MLIVMKQQDEAFNPVNVGLHRAQAEIPPAIGETI